MNTTTTIAALYHFTQQPITNCISLQQQLRQSGQEWGIQGTLLIAPEGINGTIAGSEASINSMIATIEKHLGINKLTWKKSTHTENPFYRYKVKIKKEIVTLGQNSKNVARQTGQYIQPKDWNTIINDPETIVIDTRNDYETAIGKFPQALDPDTKNFRDFPEYVKNHLSHAKKKKIAMYCTGGIRCEKASNYLIEEGFEDVCQLHGGILQYLEDVPSEENQWQGECFVFDNRVSVDRNINKGQYDQCYACRLPITDSDKDSPFYQAGISCPHCHKKTTATQKSRYRQRQLQQTLAKKTGRTHIGPQKQS